MEGKGLTKFCFSPSPCRLFFNSHTDSQLEIEDDFVEGEGLRYLESSLKAAQNLSPVSGTQATQTHGKHESSISPGAECSARDDL